MGFKDELDEMDIEIENFIQSLSCTVVSHPWLTSFGRSIRFDESFVKAIKQYCGFIGDLATKFSFCTFLLGEGWEVLIRLV